MTYEQELDELEKQFGKMDSEKLIEKIKLLINNPLVDISVKSRGLCLMGSIISCLSPYLADDEGYSYFKKALELDDSNYEAILGICFIFNTYPYPFNTILTEVEYLSYIQQLIKEFDYMDERQRRNVLQSINAYAAYRTKVIEEYGYPVKWEINSVKTDK